MFDQLLLRIGSEIKDSIRKIENPNKVYRHQSGRRMSISEVIKSGVTDGPIAGALAIFYASGQFLSLDRIVTKENNKFGRQRRIIYHLDSRTGQIGSTILLELLKISDGEPFSKAKFVHEIDKQIFNDYSVSSGEINEALSRMFRKTMKNYFGIEGKYFKKSNFAVYFQEISGFSESKFDKNAYDNKKLDIDQMVNAYLKDLNKLSKS
jgi:hypothetical protein